MPDVFVHELVDPTGESIFWLRERGVSVRLGSAMWRFPPESLTEDELIAGGEGCVALMGGGGNLITRRVIEALPELRYISKYGIGMNSIDLKAVKERDIVISYTPIPPDTEATAEHTIAVMLALKKRLYEWTPQFMCRGGWRSDRIWADLMTGETIGLVGYGRVGQAVARRMQGWGVRILANDPSGEYDDNVTAASINELLTESDVVSLHATLTDQTRHLISERELGLMKPGALLINTARGALIDVDRLVYALQQRSIGGAAVDVYESEPPSPHHPLFQCENVIVTPHAAAWTKFTMIEMGRIGAENLWEMLSGRKPIYRVDIS